MQQYENSREMLEYVLKTLSYLNPIEEDAEYITNRLIDLSDEISVFLDEQYYGTDQDMIA